MEKKSGERQMSKMRYRTLRENVVDEIKGKILNRELKPGMRIIEQNLSDELEVSRKQYPGGVKTTGTGGVC